MRAADVVEYLMTIARGVAVNKKVVETYEGIIETRPGQKAVIASGYAKTMEVGIAQELGAGKYLKKLYTLEKIGLAVKEELEKK